MSISFLGCFGPSIVIDIMMYFFFIHNQGAWLYMHRSTGHVLCLVLISPNGFIPSVHSLSHILLGSSAKSLYFSSIDSHWAPSFGCLKYSSAIRSSWCHCNLFASLGFANKCFNLGIKGKYQTTLNGIPVLISSSNLYLFFARLCLYHGCLHMRHACKSLYSPRYNIQSCTQACIFWTSSSNGQTTFFASFVLLGSTLSSGRMSLKRPKTLWSPCLIDRFLL